MPIVDSDEIYLTKHVFVDEQSKTQTAIVADVNTEKSSVIMGIPMDIDLENTKIYSSYIRGNPKGSNDFLEIVKLDEYGKNDYSSDIVAIYKNEKGEYCRQTEEQKKRTDEVNKEIIKSVLTGEINR